jgi:pimeloyl-ACP methyl ester carboxylesterase
MFRYDTGAPFLSSASMLRRQLAAVRQAYDPMRANPNLSRMVLVGHSMGGLVSKLQVTNSGDVLWQSAATRPLAAIYTDPATRSDLTNAFYFAPSPDVTRVIYIATPHRGSSTAQRCVGRISSALVEDPPLWRARHEQLVRDNPGAFRSELNRGIPTSVDLLEPGSDILQATAQLCYRPDVRLHSVIGNGRWSLSDGSSDGVVAVSSARLLGVRSEVFVPTEHTEINRRPETSCEVMRILSEHLVDGAASY